MGYGLWAFKVRCAAFCCNRSLRSLAGSAGIKQDSCPKGTPLIYALCTVHYALSPFPFTLSHLEAYMLHIALAKGRIAKTVMKKLIAGGFCFPDYSDDSRKLVFTDSENLIRVALVKSPDVTVYVRRGAADCGIVGKDVLIEDDATDVYEILDLGIGCCRMAVSGIAGKKDVMRKRILTVATKYPTIARRYFADRFQPIDIVKLNGSVELAPLVGLSDVIVDIVETGTTLSENGMEVYDYFMDFSARLICNTVSYKVKQNELKSFTELIK